MDTKFIYNFFQQQPEISGTDYFALFKKTKQSSTLQKQNSPAAITFFYNKTSGLLNSSTHCNRSLDPIEST